MSVFSWEENYISQEVTNTFEKDFKKNPQ